MSVDLRYYIAIDAAQADAELARLHKEATTAAGSQDRMTAATKATTTALKDEAAAAKQATTATTEVAASTEKAAAAKLTLQQRVAKLPDLLGKQAAAISLVSSSLEGMGGNVGKAVAGAGQLAAAYGAGGPFALALVAGIALVDQLTQHWKALNDEEDRNLKAKYAGIDAQTDKLSKLRAEIADLQKEADPAAARAAQREAIAADIARLSIESQSLMRRAEIVKTTREEAQTLRANARLLDEERGLLTQKLTLMAKIKMNGEPTGARGASPSSSTSSSDLAAGLDVTGEAARQERRRKAWRAGEDALRAEQAVADESAAASAQVMQEQRLAAEDKMREIRRASEDNDYEQRLAAEQRFWSDVAGYATAGAGIVAGVSTQLIADLISGQEKALERAGLAFMAQAGQALVGYGIQAIGRGVLEASSLITAPLAPASFAAGAALIGAGVSLGGVSAGLGALMGGGANKGAAERGPSPRSSSSANTGPSTTSVTYIYAPSRDEGAAIVTQAGKRADARGFEKEKVR